MSSTVFRLGTTIVLGIAFCSVGLAQPSGKPTSLPGTAALTETRPLDEVMVAGIDRFALDAIEQARRDRSSRWQCDTSSHQAYEESLRPYRAELARILGVVDERPEPAGLQYIASEYESALVADTDHFTVLAVRWPALDGISGEGLLLNPSQKVRARVVLLPDASWTPEMMVGMQEGAPQIASRLAAMGCQVLIPTLINRDHTFSANPAINRRTNLTHREFIYRQAFELGRHVIGYEVQKVLAAVDQFQLANERSQKVPIAVMGVNDGGQLAMYAGALDPRIDATVVSGYFDQREKIWQEPIDRNVWRLLNKFGDAEIARMIAPRLLYIEVAPKIPTVDGPPQTEGRNVAAPGSIEPLDPQSVRQEVERALQSWPRFKQSAEPNQAGSPKLITSPPELDGQQPLQQATLSQIVRLITGRDASPKWNDQSVRDLRGDYPTEQRQRRQVQEMVDYTQQLLHRSQRARDEFFKPLDRRSVAAWQAAAASIRDQIHEQLIGKLSKPTVDPKPRTRQILREDDFTGYEVVLDVYPDVIAAGILLLPNDLQDDEKRPVVVCQHGLEGVPMDTIEGPDSKGYRAYKSFAAELARRGFIVYAPQNPYRGGDRFRTLQRKSNPLGRSLFSYIVPQHLVTLRWLASLPHVDSDRIGFYGLSYGGKTAVRVPPLLPPSDEEPGYCLSICSADFNEWVSKNASVDAPFSYIWTGEYEIFEWNMGHLANYGELAMLMAPRPFMVERGHDDGVGIDEWVAWEYAKVRRHYNKLGIGDRTEIEYFDGPHTINGQGTYRFLHQHLDWPN